MNAIASTTAQRRFRVERTQQYRLGTLTDEQTHYLRSNMGATRWLWNKYVNQTKAQEKNNQKIKPSSYTVFLKEAPWLKECDAQSLNLTKQRIRQAWKRYYEDPTVGKPKYHAKKRCHDSFTTYLQKGRKNVWLRGSKLHIPKIGALPVIKHRNLPPGHHITNVTFREDTRGVFIVSISYYYYEEVHQYSVIPVDAVLGLDYSSPDFYVDSNGNKPSGELPHAFYANEGRLAAAQSRRDGRVKGSGNWWEAHDDLNRIYAYERHVRRDFTNKASAAIAKRFGLVGVEDINLRGMAGSLNFGKKTNDNGFGMFREQLAYKLFDRVDAGLGVLSPGLLVKVPRFFASTKMCSNCGHKQAGITLEMREWTCDVCGAHHVRDPHAAGNIREFMVFGLLVHGLIPWVVLADGSLLDVRGYAWDVVSSSWDYVKLLDLCCPGAMAGGTPVSAYVVDVLQAFSDGDSYSIQPVMLPDEDIPVFMTAKKKKFSLRGEEASTSSDCRETGDKSR